jgi:hypothetical protein
MFVAVLLREGVINLEDIWPHLLKQQEDPVAQLLEKQQQALDYQYQMLFKTIMN